MRAYHHRNTKKKYGFKRLDSAVSNSKQSNTVRSQDTDNHLYLTKEDLLEGVTKTRDEEIQRKKASTLEKVKLKYKKYRNFWNEKKEFSTRKNIYELVDENRQKLEERERSSLVEKK